jgi:BMFP domain-containing protein YqiC
VINFKLKNIEEILPVGQKPNLYLSWFWLTDGDLWLKLGDEIIYEYSKEAMATFENKQTPYNDYYIVRFLEDFTQLFEKVGESLPTKFYDLTKDLSKFRDNTTKWLDIYDIDEDEHCDFYFEEYDELISWTYQRTFDSGHLIGGPNISFFRNNNNLRIVWDTEYNLENGINLWTAKNGSLEVNYFTFIEKIKEFGTEFFKQMDKQVEQTLAKDWGEIKIEKENLVKEHKKRKLDFLTNLSFLEQEAKGQTNWKKLEDLYNRMTKEIK